jgi:hypothetical protein
VSGLPAADQRIALELPSNEMVRLVVDLPVEHPGRLVIKAQWSPYRVLSFRLEGPGLSPVLRRSGPSPQRIEVEVPPEALARGTTWKLRIRGNPWRDEVEGMLTIELPEPPAPPTPEKVQQQEEEKIEPWMLPRPAPPGASKNERRFFDAVENFRALVVEEQGVGDTCRWQESLLRYLVEHRDATADLRIARPTRQILERVVQTAYHVDNLRTTDDPILTQPQPKEHLRRRALETLRKQRIDPLRRALDSLLNDLQQGHAPELHQAGWPFGLLSCMMASERHFEERLLVGEEHASYRKLAIDQWDRILAAAHAVDRLLER